MMAKIKQIICISLLLLTFDTNAQEIIVGAERTDIYLDYIKDKKVGVVCNQTSTIGNKHLVDSLLNLNINIVTIFSPEHGFRGKADAGAEIKDGVDIKTGIPIVSLYGKNKKPKTEQLNEIDILVFDIQDVGARFYTYISTLHYVMEAAAELHIPLIVLDRPNPNGHYIDGPVLDTAFSSFVGMHPIPIIHGMTIAEYALMCNNEGWLANGIRCFLFTSPMLNYSHSISYDLPIKPSPNLPNARAINLYPSLCLFEGTSISIGRGTPYPFQHFGAPYLESDYSFTPISSAGSKYPKHENKTCYGTDLRFQENYLTSLNLKWLIEAYNNSPEKDSFFNNFFDKLAGTDKLRKQVIEGKTAKEIKDSWEVDLTSFKILRNKYLIYK